MQSQKNIAFDFGLQQLEGRVLMSGTALSVAQSPYNGGVQLRINATAGDDQITLRRSQAGLVIGNTGGWSQLVTGSYRNIVINGGEGNDTITIDPSVTDNLMLYGAGGNDTIVGGSGNDQLFGGAGNDSLSGAAGNDTLVDIGGGSSDKLAGGSGSDSFWLDNSKTEKVIDASTSENIGGAVHKITSFKSLTFSTGTRTVSVSKELNGQRLRDPAVTGGTFPYSAFSDRPLFSDSGPSINDVTQGYVGDCYFLSTLSAAAKADPNIIRQSVVDLGDGTFAVQFGAAGSAKSFYRVDNDLATYSWSTTTPTYAKLGQNNSMWVAIMEKAFTFYRQGTGTYASISAGWMSEAFSAIGQNASSIWTGSISSSSKLLSQIQSLLDAGNAVTFAVNSVPAGVPLVGDHAYTVDAVTVNSKGRLSIRLRNPWGVDGYSTADGKNDGYVTITAAQAFSAFTVFQYAAV
jgi:hypothetical protein